MFKLSIFLWVATFLTLSAPAHPIPTLSDCDISRGTTERRSYRSQLIQTTMHYTVYLPACYDPERESAYPTAYLLHGSAQYDDHWTQIGLIDTLDNRIASGDISPMVVVMPYGEWIANENQFGAASFDAVFLEELMPDVESAYHVTTNSNQRAIGGISRGGFWAYLIAFRNPELFAAVGGHSAFFDRYHAPPDYNPLDLALNAPNIEQLHISLDRGAYDYAREGLDLMDERLRERSLTYTYTVHPEGEHDNRYWSAHIADYIAFYADAISTPTASTPNPETFVFTPPNTVDPTDFTFTPPKATTPRYDMVLPVVAMSSTRYALDRSAGDEAAQPDAILSVQAAALLQSAGYPIDDANVREIAAIKTHLASGRNNSAWVTFDELRPEWRVLHTASGEHPLMDTDGYSLAFESPDGVLNPQQLTTLTLSGVTAITRASTPIIDIMGVHWAASGIAPYTTQVDFFHTSNEVSFTESCPQSSEPTLGAFCSKRAHFGIFELVGLDVVELSGNHNNDYGFNAYHDTLDQFAAADIATVGGGRTVAEAQQPLTLEHAGNRIAMLSCNDVGPYYALADDAQPGAAACGDWMQPVLAEIASSHDVVVVTVQHQEFEEYLPRDAIRYDFSQLADWGADVVVGTHAHKPQTFEFYTDNSGDTAFIHYGLGNLFFDQPFWGNSRFWMDTLMIYEGELISIDLFTGIIDEQARPRPMTAEERQNFLDFMFVVQAGANP